jgi:hypothetical protein
VKTRAWIFTGALLALAAAPAFAGGQSSGAITSIYGGSPGYTSGSTTMFFVRLSGAKAGGPSCQTDQLEHHFVFDANSQGGQALLSILLAAKVSGQVITVAGTGACAPYRPDYEMISHIWFTG